MKVSQLTKPLEECLLTKVQTISAAVSLGTCKTLLLWMMCTMVSIFLRHYSLICQSRAIPTHVFTATLTAHFLDWLRLTRTGAVGLPVKAGARWKDTHKKRTKQGDGDLDRIPETDDNA